MVRETSPRRLDVPKDNRRSLVRRPELDPEMFGRFAETFARFMGTARFLAWMTGLIIVWVVWNVDVGPDRPRWDHYPFIFLTLMLSLQASYAAPLILLAQNRQEARDRVSQEQDRAAAAQTSADMQFLAREIAGLRHGLGEVATRDYLRSELRGLLADLGDQAQDDSGEGAGSRTRGEDSRRSDLRRT
jgi:uncharacterized membrane protein